MDWDGIAQATGDYSWRAENMYRYFARFENAQYVPRPGTLRYIFNGIIWSLLAFLRRRPDARDWDHGHGFSGWLKTSESNTRLILPDHSILKLLLNAVRVVIQERVGSLFARAITRFDPNDSRNSEDSPEGIAFTPLAVANGKRNGPREYLLATKQQYPTRLTIQLNTLVTRVLFDEKRAVGVQFRQGKSLYQADPRAKGVGASPTYEEGSARARREVILCAGAFNSPQILKLSGVGPADELARHGIPLVLDLPGVGENLQDRYEVAVVSETPKPFVLLEGSAFAPPAAGVSDPSFDSWQRGEGLYTSNGSLLGILKRSSKELPEPDLYIFALPGHFRGYRQGYSKEIEHFGNHFTWVILKAFTNNRAGRVTLRSGDPMQVPNIEFHYFSEGSDEEASDLEAVVKGLEFVRAMNERLGKGVEQELVPGPSVKTRAQVLDFVQDEAWGHHASCTNKIGHKSDPMAVLDSRFRVRGLDGLRVVDASVFPKIPGYFIVSAVYMISEKAADVIVEDARAAS